MKNVFLAVPVVAAIFAALVSGSAFAAEPSERQIRNAFTFDIPPVWDVRDFKVEATQNFGSNIEPLYKSRFNASIEVKEDTFEPLGRLGDVLVLRQVLPAGHAVKVYGISSATLNQGQWVFAFDLQGSPFAAVGEPRGAFSGLAVVQGSDEHTALAARIEQERQAALEAERKRAAEERKAWEEAEAAQRKRVAEHFSSVERVLTSGVVLQGVYIDEGTLSRQRHQIEVSFSDYDAASGTFKARMTWQSGAILALDGKADDKTLSMVETAWIANPRGSGVAFQRYDGNILGHGIDGITCRNANFDGQCSAAASRFSLGLPE